MIHNNQNMDLMNTVLVFCSSGKGLTKSMISVEWDSKYNMKQHPELYQLIEQLWSEKLKNSIRLFNASKFRFYKVEQNILNGSIASGKFLFGTTSYKEFIGTNCAPFTEQLIKDGIEHYSDPQAYLANPVGVGGMLETNDNNLVFVIRSNICAEMPGLLDRPGGHPEPSDVLSKHAENMGSIQSDEVKDELFNSVLKEISDEINIPAKHLSYPLLLGISYNPETARRPSFEFYVRCNLTTKYIKELYLMQTQPEKDESTDLLFIPIADILNINELKRKEFYGKLTHAAQSAIYLLQIFCSS